MEPCHCSLYSVFVANGVLSLSSSSSLCSSGILSLYTLRHHWITGYLPRAQRRIKIIMKDNGVTLLFVIAEFSCEVIRELQVYTIGRGWVEGWGLRVQRLGATSLCSPVNLYILNMASTDVVHEWPSLFALSASRHLAKKHEMVSLGIAASDLGTILRDPLQFTCLRDTTPSLGFNSQWNLGRYKEIWPCLVTSCWRIYWSPVIINHIQL